MDVIRSGGTENEGGSPPTPTPPKGGVGDGRGRGRCILGHTRGEGGGNQLSIWRCRSRESR